jgi:hypothetical protein
MKPLGSTWQASCVTDRSQAAVAETATNDGTKVDAGVIPLP